MISQKIYHNSSLFQTVINGGYCIGCGVCATIKNSPIKMELDEFSKFQATSNVEVIPDSIEKELQSVCPFSDTSLNEDIIGGKLYGEFARQHAELGYFRSAYAGYVSEGEYRAKGSSGGMITWILVTLLQCRHIDGVIHIQKRTPSNEDPRIFHYQLSVTMDEIIKGSKTRYYPIETSEVIKLIRERPGMYAIVGVPCFIKAIRLMAFNDEVIRNRIIFCVGLICAHLKSARFGDFFAWQSGIKPTNVKYIDFRTKLVGYRANEYGMTILGNIDGKDVIKKTPSISKLYGTNWGYGFFKYKACDYCDDVVSETADVTIGDAWLPEYSHDFNGTNIVIVRHPLIQEMIETGIRNGKIRLEKIDPEKVVESQSSAFAHRRQGLAYRLWLADKEGLWKPKKRVEPDENSVDDRTKKKLKLRIQISERSHIAFNQALAKDDFSVFKKAMKPFLKKYEILYTPLWRRILSKIKHTALCMASKN